MTLNMKSIILHAFICKNYVFMYILGYSQYFFKFVYVHLYTHVYVLIKPQLVSQ